MAQRAQRLGCTSFHFLGHAALLIPKDEWQAQRNHHYGHRKLEFIGPVTEQLKHRIEQFADAAESGKVRIDDGGCTWTSSRPARKRSAWPTCGRALFAE